MASSSLPDSQGAVVTGLPEIYLDFASMGLVSPRVAQRVRDAIDTLAGPPLGQTGTQRTLEMMDVVERARRSIAQWLGVEPRHIALIDNTTHGLGVLAASLTASGYLGRGDAVALPDIEFISSALVWRRAQVRYGFQIRVIPSRQGCVVLDDLLEACDQAVRVVVVSAVQEVTGDRLGSRAFTELAKHLHARGGFLIVDGIQEAGVRRRDLRLEGVDAYIAGGHKWLGSPFGLGFMYVSDRLIESCDSVFHGYLSLWEPPRGWDEYLSDRSRHPLDWLPVRQEARKFEAGGMPNYVGAVGLAAAMEEIESLGIDNIEQHVLGLNRHFRDNLRVMGLTEFVLGRPDPDAQAGIVTLSLPGGVERERQLLHWLRSRRVAVTLRSIAGVGGVRFSFYTPTTVAEIDRCSTYIEAFLRPGA
ncbi:aminotransferase class V-fold PLP-dependent enzyme [Thermaerobacter sp. FW80]|uniref:aminotransferase class V-fold PLP-dependent enzyme n=1 Tax=Thermaerobacter sp. FW80 TaxID=2546351 RepID=UPI001074F14F|nr:aminotransferase class V-fold PLP-dependent enzyme [Thermaerobacter sp. FW80]QBS36626.1 aminotransferase class V-fold PLP-dependent enzyme [Thermaerobacter sp. FW80]